MVDITYGHGFLDDVFDTANWTLTNFGFASVAQASDGDVLVVTATCNDAGNEYATLARDIESLGLSTNTYPKIKIRWWTSDASGTIGFGVTVSYTAGSGGGSDSFCLSGANPGFSQQPMVTTGTLTANRTIWKITIVPDDYPDSYATGPTSVACDYILIYKGDFTLPNVANGMDVLPQPEYGILKPLSRVTDVTQPLGSGNTVINCSCDLDIGNWKRTGDYIAGEVFYEMAHRSYTEPWQWLDTGYEQMKVTLDQPAIRRHGKEHALDLTFREFRVNTATGGTYVQRYGLNL